MKIVIDNYFRPDINQDDVNAVYPIVYGLSEFKN